MTRTLIAQPLTRESFAPFGEVIDTDWQHHYPINGGMTERYHAMATAEATGPEARVVLNVFRGKPYAFPLKLSLVERHPLGSQAFVPLTPAPFLVVVCPDDGDRPGGPQAFVTAGSQGVNYPPGRWHAVLTPIGAPQDFLVVDRVGGGVNLDEFHFPDPYEIRLPEGF